MLNLIVGSMPAGGETPVEVLPGELRLSWSASCEVESYNVSVIGADSAEAVLERAGIQDTEAVLDTAGLRPDEIYTLHVDMTPRGGSARDIVTREARFVVRAAATDAPADTAVPTVTALPADTALPVEANLGGGSGEQTLEDLVNRIKAAQPEEKEDKPVGYLPLFRRAPSVLVIILFLLFVAGFVTVTVLRARSARRSRRVDLFAEESIPSIRVKSTDDFDGERTLPR